MREKISCHLWKGEQGDDQHNTYHPQASHNGEGNEHHQDVFEMHHRNPLRLGILPIESDVDNRIQETGKEADEQNG